MRMINKKITFWWSDVSDGAVSQQTVYPDCKARTSGFRTMWTSLLTAKHPSPASYQILAAQWSRSKKVSSPSVSHPSAFCLLLRLHHGSSSCSTDTVMNFICTIQMILKQQILTFTSFMHSARLPWWQFLSRLSHPLHLCFSASLRKQTLVQILMDTVRHSAVKWENKNRFNQRCVLV